MLWCEWIIYARRDLKSPCFIYTCNEETHDRTSNNGKRRPNGYVHQENHCSIGDGPLSGRINQFTLRGNTGGGW